MNQHQNIIADTLTAAKDPFYPNVHKTICNKLSRSHAPESDNVYSVVNAITDVITNRATLKLSNSQKILDSEKLLTELEGIVHLQHLSYTYTFDSILLSLGTAITILTAILTFNSSTPRNFIVSLAGSILTGTIPVLVTSIIATLIATRPWSRTFHHASGSYHVTKAKTLYNPILRKVCGTNCIEEPWSTFSYIDYRATKAAKAFCRKHPEFHLVSPIKKP